MQNVEFVRAAFDSVHDMLDTAMQDLTDEVVNYQPGGTANTIAQLLAHMVTAQDLLLNQRLPVDGGGMLHESGWAEKTGIPLNRRLIWQKDEWRLNLPAFDGYRRAVAESAARFIDASTDADLDRVTAWVNGPERPVALLLQRVYINHALGHCGEISVIKGLQGLKGLPL